MYENTVVKSLWLNVLQRFYVLQHVFEHFPFPGVSPVPRLLKKVVNLSAWVCQFDPVKKPVKSLVLHKIGCVSENN